MKSEVSAGGIIYKKVNGNMFWLLISPIQEKEVWAFPKGHVGDTIINEKLEDAALREVEEEGGIKATIIKKIPYVSTYFYKRNGETVYKQVHYYLMEYREGDPENHDHEIDRAEFVLQENIDSMLTYKGDKDAFEQALKLVN